jgi:peptide-methionine (S)-S-oxide reductase
MLINTIKSIAVIYFTAIFFVSCAQSQTNNKSNMTTTQTTDSQTDTITIGAGCFWCVEAVFQNLKGVEKVVSGYSGGFIKNPAYREVCMGTTGHAEVCQITYNPSVITFAEILEVFWQTHDPTTLNRQGNDIGTQYRSVIFYHTPEQKKIAEHYKEELNKNKVYNNPVITEINEYTNFYQAEDYHQNYFNLNGEESYCRFVILPKVDKFKKLFKDKLK